MTHQPNKQFNTYKEGLDLKVLRRNCLEHGKVRNHIVHRFRKAASDEATVKSICDHLELYFTIY